MTTCLFLDFDGVLHPDPCHRHSRFSRLPLLEAVLRAHPEVHVVISSSWRFDHTLEQLQGFFSADLRSRVVGVTGTVRRGDDEGWIPSDQLAFHREWECRKWLRVHGSHLDRWVAIDDMADWFTPGCPHLLATSSTIGFQDEHAARLHEILDRG